MNTIKLVTLFMLAFFSTHLLAYGSSSSSKKACKKPKISQFTPPHLTPVKPQSEFSFKISASTNPDSIQVNVKKQAVEVNIKQDGNTFWVSGVLPETLQDTYARVAIDATGNNGCKATDGWLLKIEALQP